MKATGFIKKIDELGRVVIPRDIRRALGVNNLESVQLFLDGDSVIMRKWQEHCVFCGSTEDISTFKNKSICALCAEELTK